MSPSGARLGLELVDEVDSDKEAPARPGRLQLRAMAIIARVLAAMVSPRAEGADERCGFVLAFERGRRLVVGGLDAMEFEPAHHVEDFCPVHSQALLKLS
jgi:hypothetical protein